MRARQASFWDYCDALLALSGARRPAAEVLRPRLEAQRRGVSQTTTYEWAQFLQHHHAIIGSGTQQVNADRLIEVCTWLRGADLGFPRLAATSGDAQRLSTTLRDQGIPHAFGAITAANSWSFYEAASSIQLYVPPDALAAARQTLNDPGGRTRVELYSQSPARLPVAGTDLEAISQACDPRYGRPYRDEDVGTRSGAPVPITRRFVTLLDCRVHPEGASHAAFLQQQLLARRRA